MLPLLVQPPLLLKEQTSCESEPKLRKRIQPTRARPARSQTPACGVGSRPTGTCLNLLFVYKSVPEYTASKQLFEKQ
jgi:hypothetical protein